MLLEGERRGEEGREKRVIDVGVGGGSKGARGDAVVNFWREKKGQLLVHRDTPLLTVSLLRSPRCLPVVSPGVRGSCPVHQRQNDVISSGDRQRIGESG